MSEAAGARCLPDLWDRAVLSLTEPTSEAFGHVLQELTLVNLPLADKYREVDVLSVLRDNTTQQGLNAIATAFNILEKYGRNLLSPNKPKFWRAVKFNNPVFKSTVDAIKGGRDILRLYGYTVEQRDGMSFPEDVTDPDPRKVAAVTAEVALLQVELAHLRKGTHPHPELFVQLLPPGMQLCEATSLTPDSRDPRLGGDSLASPQPGPGTAPSMDGTSPGAAGQGPGPEGGAVTGGDILPVTAVARMSCAVCSAELVISRCLDCGLYFCRDCDDLYHRHPARAHHHRSPVPEPEGCPDPSQTGQGHSGLGETQDGGGRSGGAGGSPTGTRPGLGRRSMSAEQQGSVPVLPRVERRPSDLSSSSPPREPWTCSGCRLANQARAVLCVGCQRPRACRPLPATAAGTPSRAPWCCQACTCLNEASSVLCCACDRPRLAGRPSFALRHPASAAPAAAASRFPAPPQQNRVSGWECQHCTYINAHPGRICEMCDRTTSARESGGPLPTPGTPSGPKLQRLEEGAAAEAARQREMREEGMRLVNAIRMAEEHLVSPEEVVCALRCSGGRPPLSWLETELPRVLETISELAVRQGEAGGRPVGPLGREEARQAWLACGGCVEEAARWCVRERGRKVRDIMAMGFSDRAEVLQALYMNGGDLDKAVVDLQRQLLEPFHARVWEEDMVPVQVDQLDRERVLRQILATYNLPSWGRAEIALSLMQEGNQHYQLHDVVEAVRESQDREFIKRSLSLSCLICFSLYPRSKMQTLTSCECTICQGCFKDYFTFTVRERHIKDLVCPGCSKPDIDDEAQRLSYFSTLDVQLRDCLDTDVYNLFHKKLTERTLMTDPKFKWCTHCSNGFIYDGNQSRVTCPQCQGSFCVECRRPWEAQHQGISCEDFQNWKRENDPEYQAQGLAAYLKENGIDCPKCKFRYALARGGCMHFTCSQCQHEFCSGCYNTFLGKKKCNDPSCRLKDSLHAHHPRDCLSYLRDWPVPRLQELLQKHGVNFDTEPPVGAEATPGGRCRVMQQREEQGKLTDEACGTEAQRGHAGLCESHYKEYLVSRINGHSLDPAQLYSEGEMARFLARCGRPQAPRGPNEDEAQYRGRLLKVIAGIPLGDKVPRIRK